MSSRSRDSIGDSLAGQTSVNFSHDFLSPAYIFAFYSLYSCRGLSMETSTHSTLDTLQNGESMKPDSRKRLKLDEIGEWSELKLEILKKYAGAYHRQRTAGND